MTKLFCRLCVVFFLSFAAITVHPEPEGGHFLGDTTIVHPLAIDGKVHVSGSFGEYRSGGRYHPGLDYKTFSVTGFPVITPLAGTLDRVHVSEYGYGNALFIRTPNRIALTFAHLQDFLCEEPDLEYFRQSLKLLSQNGRLHVQIPGWFRFGKEECIGRSGESGVGAPHLHFEIQKDGLYIDPLSVPGMRIPDTTAPELLRFYIETSDGMRIVRLQKKKPEQASGQEREESPVSQDYEPIDPLPFVAAGDPVRFMVGTYDTMAARNRNAVHRIELDLGERKFYDYTLDRISVRDFRNAGLVYHRDRTAIGREYVMLLYPRGSRGERPSAHQASVTIEEKAQDVLPVRVRVSDAMGNRATLELDIPIGDPAQSPESSDGETTNEIQRRLHPEIPFVDVDAGRTRVLNASSGNSSMKIQFNQWSVNLPGRVRLFGIQELPEETTRVVEGPGIARQEDDHPPQLRLAGPVYYFDGLDVSFLSGVTVRAEFPDANEGNVGLYYFNYTTKTWAILAIPRRRANGRLQYLFELKRTGPIAQFIDISPPRIGNRFLWEAATISDPAGNNYVREFSVSDRGSGFHKEKSQVLLDGRPVPFEWISDRSVMRVEIPWSFVPKRGALLSFLAVDANENASDWHFEFIESPDQAAETEAGAATAESGE